MPQPAPPPPLKSALKTTANKCPAAPCREAWQKRVRFGRASYWLVSL